MTPSPENPGLLNWLLILGLGIVWGTAFMSIALALNGFQPITVAALRTTLGGFALWTAGMAMGQPLGAAPRGTWPTLTIIAITSAALPFLLLAWGLQHVPSAFAGVAMGAGPLLLLPLVYLFSPDEGIGPRRVAGVLLGFVGLATLIGPGAFAGVGDFTTLGRLACVGAATCYAISSILTRRAPAIPPITFAAATLLISGAILLPIALSVEGLPNHPPLSATLALIYLALFPTGLAALLRIRVIRTAGSVFMSLVSYMVPVWAVVFGLFLLGEDLPPQVFTALALILAGIGLSQWRSLRAGLLRRTAVRE
ncbi:MAG: DMT family transporter [Pseudomonadota bacterium]